MLPLSRSLRMICESWVARMKSHPSDHNKASLRDNQTKRRLIQPKANNYGSKKGKAADEMFIPCNSMGKWVGIFTNYMYFVSIYIA